MQGQHVDVRLQFIHREEMTAHIQHHAAVAETWLVHNFYSREFHLTVRSGGHRLAQGLDSVEYPCFARSRNDDAVAVHLQLIGFRILVLHAQLKGNVPFPLGGLQHHTGLVFQESGQEFGVLLHLGIAGRIADDGSALQYERQLLGGSNLQRGRYYLIVGHNGGGGRASGHQQTGQRQSPQG